MWLANPALPDDILREAVPGNIRRAEHFVSFLKRLVQYIKGRLQTEQVESEGPISFLSSLQALTSFLNHYFILKSPFSLSHSLNPDSCLLLWCLF